MDIQDQPHGSEGKSLLPEHQERGPASIDRTRRRFARAGLGMSGVILTLASQPGMAASRVCKSPSGSLSGGLHSQPANQTLVCGGFSPGYWMNHDTKWPGGTCARSTSRKQATTFAAVFPDGATSLYLTGTLLQCMKNNDPAQDPYNLGMHLVAAYLNVKASYISYLTVESLQLMWHDLVTYGHYEPSAGVYWTANDIKIYLESTEG